MKQFFFSLVIPLALGLASHRAEAQTHIAPSDSTLLSETVEGNYLVRRYKITSHDDEAQFSLKYSIDASKLPALTTGNATEMTDLDEMMARIKQNPEMKISRIEITGYASPDGNPTSNERLALSRAEQFRSIVESRYALPASNIQIKADAEQWQACDAAVKDSSIADKEKVLAILNSPVAESSKEQQLKAIPAAWSVMRQQILPPMRRVEMAVYYTTDRIVEVRTLIEKPKPQPAPQVVQRVCPCEGFVDDETIGIVVDMSDPDGVY